VGISLSGDYTIQDRIIGCYLDYNYLHIVHPYMVVVQETFFLDTYAKLTPNAANASAWSPGGDAPFIKDVRYTNALVLGL
jgi:hypothetical protein